MLKNMTTKIQFSTIEEYIKTYPTSVQSILEKIRQIIHVAAPDATEAISYQIPAFKLNGKDLIYLAAWKEHIAMYPIPARTGEFEKELSAYIGGKGTVHFRLDKPIPFKLIEAIVQARIEQIDKK
jgi:uncharacterized protein YdhG (YjbR/CyaY superfamily)